MLETLREKKNRVNREWQANNPEKNRRRSDAWILANLDRRREYLRKYHNEYLKDPKHRIAHALRVRLHKALNYKRKTSHTRELIGCSYDELVAYIAGLFQDGMSWENYGKWHLDHKKSLSQFDLTDEVQLHQAMHFTNLQPLWALDNLRKSAGERRRGNAGSAA